jgi:hypothetical protein
MIKSMTDSGELGWKSVSPFVFADKNGGLLRKSNFCKLDVGPGEGGGWHAEVGRLP